MHLPLFIRLVYTGYTGNFDFFPSVNRACVGVDVSLVSDGRVEAGESLYRDKTN